MAETMQKADELGAIPLPPSPVSPKYAQDTITTPNTDLLGNTGTSSATDVGSPRTAMSITPPFDATTPGLFKGTSKSLARPRMAKSRFLTERPPPAQRGSLLGLKRRPTANAERSVNTADWTSDSDFSDISSEDERHMPATTQTRKELGARSRTLTANTMTRQKSHCDAQSYSRFTVGDDENQTRGKVSKKDGRLNLSINETSHKGYLAKTLGATLGATLRNIPEMNVTASGKDAGTVDTPSPDHDSHVRRPGFPHSSTMSTTALSFYDKNPLPKLNIVIMVIGSRGDVQPFLRLGKILKEVHGHRVRIATHPAFETFVEKDSGLEFFSVGGDPAEIMAFMVKNPGLIPKASSIKAGDIGKRRENMYEMFQGFWRACINATDDEHDAANRKMMGYNQPFIADAIIANPPSFAHVHCAERLGVPLHLMFTFPNSPTQQFPHPVTNIKQSNVDPSYTNFISYPLVEMMIWQGLGDLINRFRVRTLGLEPVSTLWAPGQLFRLKVAYTYLWSPGLVPKPPDWGPEIDVVGYVFLDLASSFVPSDALTEFLSQGPPPVYIGFGSIVVDDADRFTQLIFEAVEKAGVRALVSKGWGNLGDKVEPPPNIFMLGNTPHDWLFPKVSAVVHHGGAGSTAAGLRAGKPTLIVPFFADQPFWGAMVAKAGCGAEPIPYKNLTSDKLAEGIRSCLEEHTKEKAVEVAKSIEAEGDGAANAVKSFHRSLPLRGEHSMRCAILEDRVAIWQLKKTRVRLSALAAELLVENRKVKWKDLRLLRHLEWNDFAGPGEPLTGGGGAFLSVTSGIITGIVGTPFKWAKRIQRHKVKKSSKEQQQASRSDSYADQQGAQPVSSTLNKLAKDGSPSDSDTTLTRRNKRGIVKRLFGGGGDGKGREGAQKDLPDANLMSGNLKSQVKQMRGDSERNPPPEENLRNNPWVTNPLELVVGPSPEGSRENLIEDLAVDTGNGLAHAGKAMLKAPMDISVAITQGFHNAPRLYGDETVRVPHRISGIQSGLRAAGEEFAFGVYDGITGLVTQPYKGAKEEGPAGFAKGVGKGVGGFVLKDLAAVTGPFSYTMKGVHKEMIKGHQPTRFIRRARIIQGGQDLHELSNEERNEAVERVSNGWQVIMNVRTDFEEISKQGIKGRIESRKEREKWRKHGALENVDQAQKALDAQAQGKDFDVVFKQQRKELKKAQQPRKSTVEGAKRRHAEDEHLAKKEAERNQDTTFAGEQTGTEAVDQAAMPAASK
ncbi:hypothetical protein MMC25_005575 [Agyrium rufum]|nr:hypothetical protein [Agyrium rufum]